MQSSPPRRSRPSSSTPGVATPSRLVASCDSHGGRKTVNEFRQDRGTDEPRTATSTDDGEAEAPRRRTSPGSHVPVRRTRTPRPHKGANGTTKAQRRSTRSCRPTRNSVFSSGAARAPPIRLHFPVCLPPVTPLPLAGGEKHHESERDSQNVKDPCSTASKRSIWEPADPRLQPSPPPVPPTCPAVDPALWPSLLVLLRPLKVLFLRPATNLASTWHQYWELPPLGGRVPALRARSLFWEPESSARSAGRWLTDLRRFFVPVRGENSPSPVSSISIADRIAKNLWQGGSSIRLTCLNSLSFRSPRWLM